MEIDIMKTLRNLIACLLLGLLPVIAPPVFGAANPIQSNYIRLSSGGSTTMSQLGDPTGTGTFGGTYPYYYNHSSSNRLYYITGDAVPDPANPGEYLKPVMSSNPAVLPNANAFTLSNVDNPSGQQNMNITVPAGVVAPGNYGYHDLINSSTGLPGSDGVNDGFTGSMTTADGLLIVHTAQIALNQYTSAPDVIEFFFTVTNTSGVARVFGLSWNVDTYVGRGGPSPPIGSGDAAPFRAPGIRSFTVNQAAVGFPIPAGSAAETFYNSLTPSLFTTAGVNPYTNSVPKYIYGLHPTEDWSALIRTDLGTRGSTTWQQADYMAIDHYSNRNIYGSYFYGANNGTAASVSLDSGHMLRWNPQVLKPGETIYLAFSYGAADAANLNPGINFRDQLAPSIIQADASNTFYTNAPFTSETIVDNLSDDNILSGTITLKIPRVYLKVENDMLTGANAWTKDVAASTADPNNDHYVFNVGPLAKVTGSLTVSPHVHLDVLPQYLSDANISYWLVLNVETDNTDPVLQFQQIVIEKHLYIPKLDGSKTITVTKTVNDVTGSGYAGGPFTINVNCGTGGSGTLNLAHGASGQVIVDDGSTCTITETVPAGTVNTGYTNTAVITPSSFTASTDRSVSVTNRITSGTISKGALTVTKAVTGDPAGHNPAAVFAITVACATTPSATLNLRAGESSTVEAVLNESCTISEASTSALPGYQYVVNIVPNTVTVGTASAVTVTNHVIAGPVTMRTVTVKNVVTGNRTASGYNSTDRRFTVTLNCGAGYTWSPNLLEGDIASYSVPTGSNCSLTHVSAPALNASHDWFSHISTPVGSFPVNANTDAVMTHDIQLAGSKSITVTKLVNGDPSGYNTTGASSGRFTITVTCGSAAPVVFNLADGENNSVIAQVGDVCTIDETVPADVIRAGYTNVKTVPLSSFPVTNNENITVTNTIQAGTFSTAKLAVSKTVTGTDKAAGHVVGRVFDINVNCDDGTSEVFGLRDAESGYVDVKVGALCTISEPSIPAAA
ncbi:MAG: DUF5979 domain-containing protein, partial [Burkholderiales bacterium]|nr:DUF5979 domain-containing protein [Burkholderiales bacterium]